MKKKMLSLVMILCVIVVSTLTVLPVAAPADINVDGVVDVLDAALVSAHWFSPPVIGPLGYNPIADLNSDGWINILDAAIINTHWGLPDC